jgi:antitoxin component YwqK of YwqJK toxin-antitoxin module
MIETITYTDDNDMPITDDQAGELTVYRKLYSVNNVVKKIEIFDDHQLDEIQYVKAENEVLDDIFKLLKTNTVTIITLENYKGFIIKKYFAYNDGINKSSQQLLLSDGKIICEQLIDSKGKLELSCSTKYIYDNDGCLPGEEMFGFKYNEDRSLNRIWGKEYPFSMHNQTLQASEISTYFPNLLDDNPYYKTSEFLP